MSSEQSDRWNGRAATLQDVGRVAAFLASDHAAALTSTQVNITAGALVD